MGKNTDKKALIGIMAKYPGKGLVKTRLVPPLTPGSAARLYKAILIDTIDIVDRMYFKKAIFFDPPDKKAYFDDITGPGWMVIPQTGEDLGQRLKNAFLECRDYKYPVVIIGSDSPALPIELILEAVILLDEGSDIVIGPSEDGGFYLIGIKDISSLSLDDVFKNIRWSTSHAMEDIKKNIEVAGIRLALTGPWFDLDNEEDMKKTIAWFNTHDQDTYRNTRAYIFGNK